MVLVLCRRVQGTQETPGRREKRESFWRAKKRETERNGRKNTTFSATKKDHSSVLLFKIPSLLAFSYFKFFHSLQFSSGFYHCSATLLCCHSGSSAGNYYLRLLLCNVLLMVGRSWGRVWIPGHKLQSKER